MVFSLLMHSFLTDKRQNVRNSAWKHTPDPLTVVVPRTFSLHNYSPTFLSSPNSYSFSLFSSILFLPPFPLIYPFPYLPVYMHFASSILPFSFLIPNSPYYPCRPIFPLITPPLPLPTHPYLSCHITGASDASVCMGRGCLYGTPP